MSTVRPGRASHVTLHDAQCFGSFAQQREYEFSVHNTWARLPSVGETREGWTAVGGGQAGRKPLHSLAQEGADSRAGPVQMGNTGGSRLWPGQLGEEKTAFTKLKKPAGRCRFQKIKFEHVLLET